MLTADARLWTHDERLAAVADQLELTFRQHIGTSKLR